MHVEVTAVRDDGYGLVICCLNCGEADRRDLPDRCVDIETWLIMFRLMHQRCEEVKVCEKLHTA